MACIIYGVGAADSINYDNWGTPVLDAVDKLRANDTWAESLGQASKHLGAEILHPDNIDRYSFGSSIVVSILSSHYGGNEIF